MARDPLGESGVGPYLFEDGARDLVNVELGVEAKLTKANKLSLRSVLQDSYNNIPAPGRYKNDLMLITSIVYNF